jgi:23S rRNA pseudouridine1911/1915/1917 synthase
MRETISRPTPPAECRGRSEELNPAKDVWLVPDADAGGRLDKFLAHAARVGSRGRATLALQRGKIFVNDEEVTSHDGARRLRSGDRVRVWFDRPGSARRRGVRPAMPGELRIVFEDGALVVVDKPAGLLTVPLPGRGEASSVDEQLVAHLRSRGKRKPLVVHRIDRDTSGLVVFATRPDVQQGLRDQFKRHEAERVYLAVVYGHPSPASGTWRDRLVWDQTSLVQKKTYARDRRGTDAESKYRVIEAFGETSLVEVTLVTGKRHQIRLQAQLRGHALVGEQRYTYSPDDLQPIDFPRQALHAHRLAFCHPATEQSMRFESPLPDDLLRLLVRLRRVR